MHPIPVVERAFTLRAEGWSLAAISRELGVSRSQLRAWFECGLSGVRASPLRNSSSDSACASGACPRIEAIPWADYAYLLGQYLGDGSIATMPKGVYRLRITTCDAYPGIQDECEAALAAIMPGQRVGRARNIGCTDISSYSKHWPCLLPQHGPGPKHLRPIRLTGWQEAIALETHPDRFIRGLIHSDGCRCVNRVTRTIKGELKRYEYVRYFFSNASTDIQDLFLEACLRLDIGCRPNGPRSLSVARRRSVERLDAIVGPKR